MISQVSWVTHLSASSSPCQRAIPPNDGLPFQLVEGGRIRRARIDVAMFLEPSIVKTNRFPGKFAKSPQMESVPTFSKQVLYSYTVCRWFSWPQG